MSDEKESVASRSEFTVEPNETFEEEEFEDCVQSLNDFDAETDEEYMKECESLLTNNEIDERKLEALDLKENGNSAFKLKNYEEAEKLYTSALRLCPVSCADERSVLYSNRAAARHRLNNLKKAVEDCTKSIKLNEKYVKPYSRRAVMNRELGSDHLDESLADFKKVLELDPTNKDAAVAVYELQKEIEERNEKLKTEMMGKLKDLGNLVLKPFGLSTDNFQLQQNAETGGYSINFKQ